MRRSAWAARRIAFQRTCEGTRREHGSFLLLPGTPIQGSWRSSYHWTYCRISRGVRLRAGTSVHRKWWTHYRKPGRIDLRPGIPEIAQEFTYRRIERPPQLAASFISSQASFVAYWQIVLKKSFLTDERIFLEPLVRCSCGDVTFSYKDYPDRGTRPLQVHDAQAGRVHQAVPDACPA